MKPSIPKGTRDFSSTEVAKRRYIFNAIQDAFETYGFQPIETPSFEKSETLMGKYGEEGDRLIFKILNSGDFLAKADDLFNFKDSIHKAIKEIQKLIDEYISVNNFNSNDYYNEGFKENVHFYLKSKLKNKLSLLNTKFVIKNLLDIKFTDKLAFRDFQNIGDLVDNLYKKNRSIKITSKISEKALRYDLTVPFARYVVQHQNEITFPFKRYQIQPVWRADRPQKGRFREFYQCDADVVGSKSLLQEVEFVQLYDAVFSKLNLLGTTIKINNRKILSGIAEVIGAKDKLIDFTVALDKLDKIGEDGVVKEMLAKGISSEAIKKVNPLFHFSGSNIEKLTSLETMLQTSEEGLKGVEELRFVIDAINELGLSSATLEVDVTLARGLDYYTGAIFEVSAPENVQMGSIGGGGRYDDLTGVFGLKDVSGVGISFGLDRIYLVMEELGLLQAVVLPKPKVLFLNFEETTNISKLKAIKSLRAQGVKSEIYPDVATSNKQQKKQWKYVGSREIEFVVSKIDNSKFVLKNMTNGEQTICSLDELIENVT